MKIAEIVDYAPIRVYEVATFYSMFNRQPVTIFYFWLCLLLLQVLSCELVLIK